MRSSWSQALLRGALFGLLLVGGTASEARAAASFEIVVADDWVDGTLSGDGSAIAYTRASADASVHHRGLDGTPSGGTVVWSPEGVYLPAISGDGKVVTGLYNDGGVQAYEWREGTLTVFGSSPYSPMALSGDGGILAANDGQIGRGVVLVGGLGGVATVQADLPGGDSFSRVFDISADGTTVVGVSGSAAGSEAVRWDSNVALGLGDLPGGSFSSSARAVSADGTTVVGSGSTAVGNEAFRWVGGSMSGLGLLHGATSSWAGDVSGDGSVVVGSSTGPSGSRPFIWDEAHGMRDLAVLFAALGLDLTDLELHAATAVSDDGRTILGTGTSLTQGSIIWVAVIPEPSTGLLLAVGLGSMAAQRRSSVRLGSLG